MLVKCWGSRGSIPVSGNKFMKYGGDTTCIEIRTKSDDIIIIDAGTGIRRLGNSLSAEGRYEYNFIITHAHWDHLMGFPFFKPLYNDKTEIHMQRSPFPKKFMENMISKVMTPPNFPIRYSELKARLLYENGHPDKFHIGSVTVVPIPLSHPNKGMGYKFIEDGKVFVFLTDNELGYIHPGGASYDEYCNFASSADLLFHDAEYTPDEYETRILWGHSTYIEAVDLAIKAGVKKIGLFHHNQDRSDKEIDEIVDICRVHIAEKKSALECFAVACNMEFEL
ncbi:MAG: MBL fold metallo-hydrolase [Desulfosarcina sp.]|nr:MBL fold metallo-hydrolase [Desulfobacterales bacterium]